MSILVSPSQEIYVTGGAIHTDLSSDCCCEGGGGDPEGACCLDEGNIDDCFDLTEAQCLAIPNFPTTWHAGETCATYDCNVPPQPCPPLGFCGGCSDTYTVSAMYIRPVLGTTCAECAQQVSIFGTMGRFNPSDCIWSTEQGLGMVTQSVTGIPTDCVGDASIEISCSVQCISLGVFPHPCGVDQGPVPQWRIFPFGGQIATGWASATLCPPSMYTTRWGSSEIFLGCCADVPPSCCTPISWSLS